MSNIFDTLYNNINSNQAAGLNEYEKSVFLTKAQGMIVKEYFNARTDGVGGGFDGGEKRQYDFSMIVRTKKLERLTGDYEKLDQRSKVWIFPEDYFLSVNEMLWDGKYQYSVLPVSYGEYRLLMMKPYNFPVKRAVWRILTGETEVETTASDGTTKETVNVPVAEVIGKFDDEKAEYRIRYVRTLKPIILDKLTNYGEDVTIEGEVEPRPCELPKEVHQEIVERAVTLAQIAWNGSTATAVAAQQQQNNK